VRNLILVSVVLASLTGLLFFASEGRPQNAVVLRTDLRFAALPIAANAPADNPGTPDKIALGRLLFWDPVLSGHQDVACATCHHPRFGYAENRDISIGVTGIGLGASRHFQRDGAVPFVKRNSQTILNTAFNGISDGGAYSPSNAPMFWDLRASGLEAQALEPIKTLEEMRGEAYPQDAAVARVVARLNENTEYRQIFARAFGGRQPITADQLGKSLRNLKYTAPYMHTGVFDTLRDVLDFYDDVSGPRGRARNAHVGREQLDPLLRQLRDPDDRAGDLIAFLESLTDDSFDRTVPVKVPSGLKPGGNIQ
jgi:cytochrome c peroxidase